MATREEQKEKIESMRASLHELVMIKKGNMIDPEVADLSAKLDELIVQYQKTEAKCIR